MRPIAVLLSAALLAGCLGAPQPSLTGPGGDPFAGLAAEGAEVTRTGDALTFAWDATLAPSGGAGFLVDAAELRSVARFTFDIGPGIGRLVATALGEPAIVLTLRDGSGGVTCHQGATGGGVCDLPAPPGLTAPEAWTLEVRAQEDPDHPWPYVAAYNTETPVHVEVALHRGTPPPLGDPSVGVDGTIGFTTRALGFGGEPTLGATGSGALFVVQNVFVHRSRDGGATWQDVTPPWDATLGTTFDPFLYVDARTGRVMVSHLNIACSNLSWSDDEGQTWVPSPAGCLDPVQDHQKLAVGDHPGPVAVYDGTMYYSESKVWASVAEVNRTAIVVSRSTDNGATWVPSVAHLAENTHRGQGNLMADTAGNVYVTWPMREPIGAADVGVSVSHDHGATWRDVIAMPGAGPGLAPLDPDLAIDAGGNVYAVTEGGQGRVMMARSRDHGDTWDAPFPISPPGLTNGPFTAAVAGAEGMVAVAWVGTADTANNANDAPSWARQYLYVTWVEDALGPQPRFTTARVNPVEDPIQVGAICTRGIACAGGGEQRNLLDFIDATVLPDGRVAVAYTDGCERCTRASDSRGSEVWVAVQGEQGPRLR